MPLTQNDLEVLKRLLDDAQTESTPDPHIRLLTALAPFLPPDRQQRLPAAIGLVKFLKGGEYNA
ncbi:MAG TPA: hypothetical protein PK629_10905 [Oscillospiraceae bacterium]|nr:hypothetical protein [Oscillospiraceae bacterium]HPF55034.1 hypothetical protein [Clostridiales bacterium]HPK35796.1 hypothetical protein [Oscillospiraceae bacterium]HPR75416.1 hypothetical protein [Oscillospiraceae bacterium]